MNYTHNETHKVFYERAWDILVEHAGASKDPMDKLSFVQAYTQIEHPCSEFRFCGLLGFGGKFWRNARGGGESPFYVQCYPEDRTKPRERVISKVNDLLKKLFEEMKPNSNGP